MLLYKKHLLNYIKNCKIRVLTNQIKSYDLIFNATSDFKLKLLDSEKT